MRHARRSSCLRPLAIAWVFNDAGKSRRKVDVQGASPLGNAHEDRLGRVWVSKEMNPEERFGGKPLR